MQKIGKQSLTFKKIKDQFFDNDLRTQKEMNVLLNPIKYQIEDLLTNYFTNSLEENIKYFRQTIQIPINQLGKRSNQILFAKCRKYVLKKISSFDLETLQKLLPFLHDYFEQNNQSLLCRFHKVFKIKMSSQGYSKQNHFLIMQGLRPSFQHKSYDIKGYLQGRKIKGYSNCFGKDFQFINSKQLKQLLQSSTTQQRTFIISLINKDISLLQQHDIMDYSVLMTFSKQEPNFSHIKIKDQYISVGIIDYLQQFNNMKKIQCKLKSWFKSDYSAINSKQYGKRLITFLKKYLNVHQN